MRALLAAATVLFGISQARAASVSEILPIAVVGDFPLGAYDDEFLSFDPSLGELKKVNISVAGTLDWGQLFFAESPGIGTIQALGSLSVFGGNSSLSVDAPPRLGKFDRVSNGFFPEFRMRGSFSDDPSLYQDPSNPVDVETTVQAADVCFSNCSVDLLDDSFGRFLGTMRATFVYQPANGVPEPSSLALLGVAAATLAGSRLRRAPTE